MPTRTEVIQGLRARDELQDRDLALILDYLEEVAGSSSGTRAAILSSRRRVQDEVTPRDIEAIYDYLAELGTPANGFEVLRRLLRRRDLFGIQVANFIMDEIDGATFTPMPPALANLQHWFSAQDTSTLFEDASGLDPAEVGDDVVYLGNKGLDGSAIIDGSGSSNVYRGNNGPDNLNYLESNGSRGMQHTSWPGILALASGYAIGGVWSRSGISSPSGWFYDGSMAINPSSSNWNPTAFSGATPITTTYAFSDWAWWYLSVETDGVVTYATEGLAEGSEDVGTYVAFGGGTGNLTFNHGGIGRGAVSDLLLWDRPLVAGERADLVTYFQDIYPIEFP